MNDNNNKKPVFSALSWIAIILLFSLSWPVALVLLILKLTGNDLPADLLSSLFSKSRPAEPSKQAKAPKQAAWTPPPPRSSSQTRPGWQQEQKAAASNAEAGKPGKKPDDAISRVSKGKLPLQIFGWVLLATAVYSIFSVSSTSALVQLLVTALCGGGMLFAAWRKGRKERDYQKCIKVVGQRAVVDLRSLTSALGAKPKDMEADLDDMVARGYFGSAAYYDKTRDLLIVDPVRAEAFLKQQAERKAAQRAAPPKADPAKQDSFDLLLQNLDRAIGRIRNPELRGKSDLIRRLTAAIFDAVREDPSKQSKISSFVNYYFPTTLKLLENYGDFEAKSFQGENMTKSMERIEGAADSIIAAYQRQLDSLFLSDSMDIDSDIDVLETMLKRDGLSGSDFSAGQSGSN